MLVIGGVSYIVSNSFCELFKFVGGFRESVLVYNVDKVECHSVCTLYPTWAYGDIKPD